MTACLPDRRHSEGFTWPRRSPKRACALALTRCSRTPIQLNSEKWVRRSGGVGRGLKKTPDSMASVSQCAAAAQGSESRWQAGSLLWRSPRPCSQPPFPSQPSHLSAQILPRGNRESPDQQTADYSSHSQVLLLRPDSQLARNSLA